MKAIQSLRQKWASRGAVMCIAAFVYAAPLLADGEQVPNENPPDAYSADKDPSLAAFDKRLPPVIPGEELERNGRRTRVWSTSGPVPVAEAPEPWKEKSGIGNTTSNPPGFPVGVIVDQRRPRR